ncbi:hypothetical protein [Pedobacter sp. MR2016-24]|uniref:hypothetical protein n=1 Tax=Pedobacter sp. MR2016-24 TaxID=2994466 RepID=UPI002247D9F7|nr:hypothetical protein [Pedobacter sp. MR2016-24]MCX2483953.1 hypothetical protein [Pedobacter sp. MR2016-24]
MTKIFIGLASISLFFSACNNDQASKIITSKVKTELRSFTDTSKLDTFKIVLNGDKPKNMELVFTITPAGASPVYTKILKAKDLLDNYKETLDLAKEKKQFEFVQQEMDLFFEDENFLEPAVTDTEQPDQNTPDKNFFAELKLSGLNGFKYRLGKESKVYIAWSNTEKKTKVYYQCCQK